MAKYEFMDQLYRTKCMTKYEFMDQIYSTNLSLWTKYTGLNTGPDMS